MELLVAVAAAVAAWWWWKRSKQNAAVADSALRSLVELDSLAAALWEKFEAAIRETPDPAETCRAVVAMDRTRLPDGINELWARLDDISHRINQRAEHYEVVARRPAPRLEGRTAGDELMLKIRETAAKKRSVSTGKASAGKTKKKDVPTPSSNPIQPIESRSELSAMVIEMMIVVSMEQLSRNPDVRDGEVGFKAFASLEEHLGAAGALEIGLTTRRVTDWSSVISAILRLNAAKAVARGAENKQGQSGDELVRDASENVLRELEAKAWPRTSRVSKFVPDVVGLLAQRYSADQEESALPASVWVERFGRDYEARFG